MDLKIKKGFFVLKNEIKTIVENYFKHLFKDSEKTSNNFHDFLLQINFPKLTKDQRIIANACITMMEITMAISKQTKKSPRQNGIPAEYYKEYENILAQNLKDFISNILDGGLIPESWKYSTMTLIPKEGKDHKGIQN